MERGAGPHTLDIAIESFRISRICEKGCGIRDKVKCCGSYDRAKDELERGLASK